MLSDLDRLPEGFLAAAPGRLHEVLPGPALIHLPGRREPPLFVSVLLHGNEATGLHAAQEVLRRYAGRGLPRAMSLFIGNVAAARHGVRRLTGQPDYNRVWPGGETDGTPEHAMMRRIVEAMRRRGVFASIDIHNNTGTNPHYACVTRLDPASLNLAVLFSRTVVFFRRPTGVQAGAFAEICPAATVECGKEGDAGGLAHAADFIEACLHLDHFPAHPPVRADLDLYHTVATVKVPDDVSISFGEPGADLCFVPSLDHLNFRELGAGSVLATVASSRDGLLDVRDQRGASNMEAFLSVEGGKLKMRRRLMPAMLSLDERAIRQDCLCYLMERLAPGAG
jgi:hypothetical protein